MESLEQAICLSSNKNSNQIAKTIPRAINHAFGHQILCGGSLTIHPSRMLILLLLACLVFPGIRNNVYGQRITNRINQVDIARSDQNGVRFSYRPEVTREKISADGRTLDRYRVSRTTLFSKTGEPEIPVRTFVFAVPPSASPEVRIIAADSYEEADVDLAPVPSANFESEIPEVQYPAEYSLESSGWFPASPLIIEQPAYAGDLRIVRIHLAPIQYDPAAGIVKKYRRIEIEVSFNRSASRAPSAVRQPNSHELLFLQKSVLNHQQARNWFEKKTRPLKKQRRYWSNGTYYKFPISEDGIYRLTGSFLQENGIQISTIDPSTIKIFNNGPKSLPRDITAPRPDSLIENAIRVVGVEDNRLDPSDYILFYGIGVNGWEYNESANRLEHFIDLYTRSNVYWLTFNDGIAGKRMETVEPPSSAPQTINLYRAVDYIENDIANIHNSGLNWYGHQFVASGDRVYNLDFPNFASTSSVEVRANFLSTSGSTHQFQVSIAGSQVGIFSFFGSRVNEGTVQNTIQNAGASPELTLRYTGSSQLNVAYLDWLEIIAESQLRLVDGELDFFGERENSAVEYHIAGASGTSYDVYDISDFHEVKRIAGVSNSGNELIYRAHPDPLQPHHYHAAQSDMFREIELISIDEPSDLRNTSLGADFVIITHESFIEAASSLKNLRESVDGLSTIIVNITDVFDEFSGGRYDPTAIRDFLKYAYDNWTTRPYYVLLFGDGDYDYRNILTNDDSNWIPTYQTAEIVELDNRTVDDWFGYVNGADRIPDLVVGRIPVRTTAEAETFVDKLVQYESSSSLGSWRNKFVMVADDELLTGGRPSSETIHTRDAEDIAENYVPPRFDVKKIYLMEYPVVLDASASAIRKPSASESLLNEINDGSLVVNFVGHGNPRLWTHERVLLDSRDAEKIQNGNKYIFFITATCDFGRFDDPLEQSFAERLLVMENRGAIGLLSSARLVYASPNADFNRSFVEELFRGAPSAPVGEAMRIAKINTFTAGVNNEKFHILGDPTLRLKVPGLDIEVTEVTPDSLKALSLITVKGNVVNPDSSTYSASGKIFAKTLDSRRKVTYTTQFGNSVTYNLAGNPIFRGSGAVTDGAFQFQFIVPKDISYGGKEGRISLYFQGEQLDGTGYLPNLIVDGTSNDLIDGDGPSIEFRYQDNTLVDFVLLNREDIIDVRIEDDKSGINITGDVGHKIIALPDGDVQNAKEITQFFQYDQDNYLRGSINLPLSLLFPEDVVDISDESHSLSIKAWDNANNSAQSSIQFRIISSSQLRLENVLNYPNPFLDQTYFTFILNADAEIEIKIFTLAGRQIARLPTFSGTFGFNSLSWNGRDEDGDALANGVYLYQLKAKTLDESAEHIGKIIKMK